MAVSGSAPSRPFFCGRNKHRAIPIRCGFRDTQVDIQRSTVRSDLSLSYQSSFVFLSTLLHVFMTVCNCASGKRAEDFDGVNFRMNAFTLSHLSLISFRCLAVSLAFFALPPRLAERDCCSIFHW